MQASLNIAIAAEFELCEKLVQTLENSDLNLGSFFIVEIYPFQEEQSIRFKGKTIKQIQVNEVNWGEFDYVLFAGDTNQMVNIAQAIKTGTWVIDLKGICSSLANLPVIVPGVNNQDLDNIHQHNIVCLPNPVVSQLALALKALWEKTEINQISVSSLLPVSYHNSETISKLAGQTAKLLNGIPLDENEQRLAFDVSPVWQKGLEYQLQKIFPQARNLCFHSVQVPVFYGMAQQVSIFTDYPIEIDNIIHSWQSQSQIEYQDQLITPVSNGEQEQGESELKLHISDLNSLDNGIQFWTVADDQGFLIAKLGIDLLQLLYHHLGD